MVTFKMKKKNLNIELELTFIFVLLFFLSFFYYHLTTFCFVAVLKIQKHNYCHVSVARFDTHNNHINSRISPGRDTQTPERDRLPHFGPRFTPR